MTRFPMELGIDTSTRFALVGLSRGGEGIAELTWRSERNHSVELVPAIRELMAHARARMDDIQAVFVAGGPGGFSALRVGMSTAKSLAEALSVPLIAVGTLDIEAQPYLELAPAVVALIEAGKDRLYVGRYARDAAREEPVFDVGSHESMLSAIDAGTLVCGEGAQAVAGALRERLGGRALLADVPPPTRRASVLAQLAYRRWEAGNVDDPAALQPFYLRSSQVTTAQQTWARI